MRNQWLQLTGLMGLLSLMILAGCGQGIGNADAASVATGDTASGNAEDEDSEEDVNAASVRSEIEAIDVESTTHITLDLKEGVAIDADVTPYEMYQDGVSAYYYENYMEGIESVSSYSESDASYRVEYTADDFAENPSLLGQALEVQVALLEEYLSCNLDLDAVSFERNTNSDYYYITDGSFCELTIPDAAGGTLYAVWQKHDADGRLPELRFRYPNEYVLEKKDEAQEAAIYDYPLTESLMNNDAVSSGSSEAGEEKQESGKASEDTDGAVDITEAEGSQTQDSAGLFNTAVRGRELVEALTGLPVSEENLVVPLEAPEESGEEIYAFYYFFEKDGLPLMRMAISTKYTNDLVLSEELEEIWSSGEGLSNGILFGAWVFCEEIQEAADTRDTEETSETVDTQDTEETPETGDTPEAADTQETGDTQQAEESLQTQEFRLTGVEINQDVSISEETYKEKETVVDVRTALLSMAELFEDVKLEEEITVTDIRLVYNTSFSSREDGEEAMPILTPYWCFTYYMQDRGNVLLMFDAYTGEFAGSGIFKGNADTGL